MTLNKTVKILGLALCASFPMFGADAPVIADTYVSSANPGLNFGNLATLNVNSTSKSLLQFTMSSLPAGVTGGDIFKGTLSLWVNRVGATGAVDIELITSNWTEATATGAAPPTTTASGLAAVPIPASALGSWVMVDVTTLVKNWVNAPASNFGIALDASSQPATNVSFDSKENVSTSHPAHIDIVVDAPSLLASVCNLYIVAGRAAPAAMGCGTCSDFIKNNTETDIDCGGGVCAACAAGKTCHGNSDCSSGTCSGGVCTVATPTCNDGIKNGNETDVDCGGSCPACAVGKVCGVGSDCSSKVCGSGVCKSATCSDGVKNGSETDVDCGGGNCAACSAGKVCTGNVDCASNNCTGGICSSCSAGQTSCNGICVVTSGDANNCGACGVVCPSYPNSVGRICTVGVCGFPGCSAGFANCNGIQADGCEINLNNDQNNCGTCGNSCGANHVCSSGACACSAGLTSCAGACLNLTSDSSNCGACGHACGGGQVCSGSACVCSAGLTSCGGACQNLVSDPNNCGACGHACLGGQTCSAGACH